MEDKEFECICENCGNSFLTDDEDEVYCADCWKRVVSLENEGSGEAI